MRLFQGSEGGNAVSDRRFGRVRVEGLTCNRGRIIDLSIRGMRVRACGTWAPGEHKAVTLRSAGTTLTLPATCVWSRREGIMRWTIGLSFESATPDQLRVVGEMALAHSARLDAARAA